MKKFWFTIICIVVCIADLAAQQTVPRNGAIRGTVMTADNQPAPYVSIQLKNTLRGAVSKEDGSFIINKLAPGDYTLLISLTGFNDLEKTVTVQQHETIEADFVLTATVKELQEIVVVSGINKLGQKESDYVARMPLGNLENPQVYSVVNSKLIEQQVIVSFDDALKSAAGVVSGGTSPGTRSYSYLRGFDEQAFFRDGKMLGNWTENDMANIERIEVIKGPSGTLFGGHGRANYGGVVNRVTKKPYDAFGGSLSLVSGNYGYNRLTADINTPISKDSSMLGRVNAAYRKEKSFQDYGWAESFFAAPAFSYAPNDRLKLVVQADIYGVKGADRGLLSSVADISSLEEINFLHDISFTSNEIVYSKRSSILSADAIYRISDSWVSTTSYGFSHSDYDYNYVIVDILDATTASRGLGTARYDIDFTSIQQNFNGDFHLGKMRNRLLVGLDYLRDDEIYVGGDAAYDEFTYHEIAPYIGAENFAAALNVPSWTGGYVNSRYGAYISNVIDFTPELHVMASVRYEYSKDRSPDPVIPNAADKDFTFSQGAWIPKFGVVYEVLPDQLSIFGNYMGGTRNINSFLANDGGSGRMQKAVPEKATQWEAGIKSDLFARKLSLMISFFDITVDNKLRTDPSNPLFNLQDGTQRNKGVEAELFANPVRGMDVQLGCAFLDAKFLNGTDAGKRPAYTPESTFNYWISYGLPQGKLKGLGLGAGGNYRNDSFIGSDNMLVIPGVHTLNATIFYDQPKYRLALKADNLTNELYWGDYLNPQPPLVVRGVISFRL